DPAPWFSTAYYLERNPDIRAAQANPFVHYVTRGREEGRLPADYTRTRMLRGARRTISAIVPTYNHARFLEQRIRSIVEQKGRPDELIILDDASTDGSRELIERLVPELDLPVVTVFNETRSGNVFRQWEKGISLARGDLVWICESDDFAELD